ncbi:hypothetical protein FACS1894109_20890 [Spirochaetia bacterium]|nr:hypothetical protein FACS1894109_20890 [Spirochaetia bacterium]
MAVSEVKEVFDFITKNALFRKPYEKEYPPAIEQGTGSLIPTLTPLAVVDYVINKGKGFGILLNLIPTLHDTKGFLSITPDICKVVGDFFPGSTDGHLIH